MTPDIANPSGLKKCDIVMIIYPGVVSKLAECYQFESIGGTSAGAIAAALTAAAEFARRTGAIGGRDPFGEVAKIPGFLAADSAAGGGSNLFRLFQPQPRLRGLFKFLTAFLLKGWAH